LPFLRKIIAIVVLTITAAVAGAPGTAAAKDEVHVYLMRGFLDVSTGLDDLAAKLKRRKIAAEITTYLAESDVAARALRDHKSNPAAQIVLIGHSLGANAAIHVAQTLQSAKVPVALIVVFSPAATNAVPGNVARAVNYYQSDGIWNNPYSRGAGFKGSLRNVDLARDTSIHHLNIEKVTRLHNETIRAITALAGGQTEAAAAAGAASPPGPSK